MLSTLSFSMLTTQTFTKTESVAQSREEKTAELFRNNCARCHGADGRGDIPLGHTYQTPDFTDMEWWKKHHDIASAASLTSIVSRGKGGMPAFGKKISRAEIRRLVDYVQRFKKQARVSSSASH